MNYFVVAENSVPAVANYTAGVIKSFQNHGMVLAQTSFAGHSLGAQIAGLVGKALNGELGFIYGE